MPSRPAASRPPPLSKNEVDKSSNSWHRTHDSCRVSCDLMFGPEAAVIAQKSGGHPMQTGTGARRLTVMQTPAIVPSQGTLGATLPARNAEHPERVIQVGRY